MPWRYGIIKFRNKNNPKHRFFGVGELYYDKDPMLPFSCSDNPTEAYSDEDDYEQDNTDESVKNSITTSLENMLKDCMRYPVFDSDGPYAEAPWSKKVSLLDLDLSDSTMSDEEVEKWIKNE